MLSTYLLPPARYFHLSRCLLTRRSRLNAQPGIEYQLNEFKDAAQEFIDNPEYMEDLESDFMNVHQTHREYLNELAKEREKVRHLIVKHKYFREPHLPNLLTFGEKEQIRTLHARNSEEWTVERIAESFPATPQIVKKVLEAKWRPHSVKRIKKHDEAVIRNWEQLRSGQYDTLLTPELKEHVKKFADRKLADLITPVEDLYKRPELPKPKTEEFQSIITSCSKYAKEDEKSITTMTDSLNKQNTPKVFQLSNKRQKEPTTLQAKPNENETYLLSAIKDKREMRFEDLKQLKLGSSTENHETMTETKQNTHLSTVKLQQPSSFSNSINPKTQIANTKSIETASMSTLPIVENPNGTGLFKIVEKFKSNEITISAEDCRRFDITKVKDRIYIPRKIWKKGKLYRVEDCYYDDNGELLYRVPGMTND